MTRARVSLPKSRISEYVTVLMFCEQHLAENVSLTYASKDPKLQGTRYGLSDGFS